MRHIWEITLIGLLSGVIGTGLGGVISFFVNNFSGRLLSFVLEFSAGLMLSIVCFDLLPHAFDMGGIFISCLGVFVGMIGVILAEDILKRLEIIQSNIKDTSMIKTGILMVIGIALHNFPEGLAIGAGFEASVKLGIDIALVIAWHDISEGIAVALPLKIGGLSKIYIVILTLVSGLPTGIGALLGALLGHISGRVIAFCLGIAGGAMVYIVSSELMPAAKKVHKGRISSIGNVIGVICGVLLTVRG